jgi:hypothetical protein
MENRGTSALIRFLYRWPVCPIDFICRHTNLSCAVESATEWNGEWVMRAQAVIQKREALFAQWMSRKSTRLAVLLGVLLTMSIAVNALIILADGTRL